MNAKVGRVNNSTVTDMVVFWSLLTGIHAMDSVDASL